MSGKIKVAIAGVGNCASSLIQGIEYYRSLGQRPGKKSKATASVSGGGTASLGLMHYNLGGYSVSDIEVVAAFDIDGRKVKRPLYDAIFSMPNCTKVFKPDIKKSLSFTTTKVNVQMGEVLDGVAGHMAAYPHDRRFVVSKEKPCDVPAVLRKTKAHMLLNYLPVGSEKATAFYAESCLKAGVSFINCVPVFIASDKKWQQKFEKAGIPVIGDDIKSQMGATIIHRALTRLFMDRGVRMENTYQLNVGGNTDFLNMLDRNRLRSKKLSKTMAVQSQINEPLHESRIHIGPSDYIPWLNDNKICFLRMEGRGFGNMPIDIELRLSVEDSPNSAGVVIDAIRCAKLAIDRGIAGPLISPSSYFMKHPPQQFHDEKARQMVEEFIAGKRKR